jgi:hypothetical protein
MLAYDYVLRGYKLMARVTGRSPITFSVLPELLALVDAHAQSEGLDRYDVMRLAIAKGMVVMRIERELLMDKKGIYTTAIIKAMAGDEDPKHLEVIEGGLVIGLERDVPGGPNGLKRRRKAKSDAT